MFEILRFGVAWMAILLLAGMTSVPPEADEPSCCQAPVERDSMSFRHWISDHFKGYAPSFSPLVDNAEQAHDKQPGLCSKTESGSWARTVGDREPRPNGLLLSIFCETRYHTMWTIKYISDGQSWKEAREAVEIMSEEVVTGCLWTLSELTKISATVLEAGMEVTKEHLPAYWVDKLSRFAASLEKMGAADVGLYTMDFIATYLLELTITDVVSYCLSLREPAYEITRGCGIILSEAVRNLSDKWKRFTEFVDDHSGQPFFHSGYGLFTLIPSLLSVFFENSKSAATQLFEIIQNVEYGEYYARLSAIISNSLESGVLSGIGKLTSRLFSESCRLYKAMMCVLCTTCSPVLNYNTVRKITETFSNIWTSYVTSESMFLVTEWLRGSCEAIYGVLVTSLPVVMDVFAKAKHFIILPAFDIVSQALFTFGIPLEIRSTDDISQHLQYLAMIALHGMIAISKGSLLMTQKIGGFRKAGHIDTVDTAGIIIHWHAIYRLIGLVAIGGLVMLVGMFHKFLRVSGRYRRWPVPTRTVVCVDVRPDQGTVSASEASPATEEPNENVNKAVKIIAEQFTAVERMKSDPNYHHFHMEIKQSKVPVYLKCLRIRASRIARIRLAKECRATRKLQHAHIVRFVNWIRVGNVCALVLEYTPHGHLRSAMASPGTPFKLFEKMSVFRQILTAVIYLHKQKAAHLNIQPGSVLVFNKWNKVKLSGFGHVIKVRPDETCQEYDLHHVAGPMEALVRMQPYNPYKADTWALGSLLFYIITGNFLHEKTNTPLPAILLPVLKECDVCHQKAILSTLTTLLFYEPNRRPELIVVLQKINDLKK